MGDHPQVLLQKCMWAIFDVLEEGVALLDKAKEKSAEKAKEEEAKKLKGNAAKDGAENSGDDANNEEDILVKVAREQRELMDARTKARDEEELWSNVKSAGRVQTDIHDAISSVGNNRIAWSMLTETQRTYCISVEARYCRVLHRHFKSEEKMRNEWEEVFGFLPSLREQLSAVASAEGGQGLEELSRAPMTQSCLLSKQNLTLFDRSIVALLPSLLPSDDFDCKREGARLRIETAIRSGKATANILPPETTVELYGSSKNNFGSDNADLDMCLMLPPGHEIPVDEKPVIIELVGESLREAGMTVQPRPTARIPIVQFVEPETGFECDVSFNNPLAICNTKLLKAYSDADPRVRPLVYVIKHWAKRRHMNTPGDGTLSSYGFIMLLLHFLQTCSPPVLPNLQRIPPDWSGGEIDPLAAGSVADLGFDIELNPVDGTPCRTYFYQPQTEKAAKALRNFGAKNTNSVGELLTKFFNYFAYDFDFRGSVVSIQAGRTITKISKAEVDGWPLHERLSIEDPFERSYDVGHVVKTPQMIHIQKEFLRAYTLISRTSDKKGSVRVDNLPVQLKANQLLQLLAEEPAELPKFVRDTRELRERQEIAKKEKMEQEKADKMGYAIRRVRNQNQDQQQHQPRNMQHQDYAPMHSNR